MVQPARRPKRESRRYQFSLRTLLFATLTLGALCSLLAWFGPRFFVRLFSRALHECPHGAAVIPLVFGLTCAAIGWAIARRVGFSLRMSVASVVLIVLLMIAAITCAYVGWTRYRVSHDPFDLDSSRLWPYPDRVILEFHDWLDARNPAPPGMIKYHGELPLLLFILDSIVLGLAGVTGACLGSVVSAYVARRRERRGAGSGGGQHRPVISRRTRRVLAVALVAGAAWILVKMEQTRRQWKDAAEWAQRGASASYRDGKLVALRFNVLTLSMRYYENKQFGDADVAQLEKLADLEDLGLTDTRVTDAGLVHLKGLANLHSLSLDGSQITDAGLVHLAGLTGLTHLDLSRTQVTDAGLAELKRLPHLQRLALGDTQISDAGLVCLTSLADLQHLDLSGTQVTDAGLDDLKGLTNLWFLGLQGTGATNAGIDRLQEELPVCTIAR